MIPVYQDRFGFGQGNCAWACIASIFERPIEDFHQYDPPYVQDIFDWSRENDVQYHERDLAINDRLHGDFPLIKDWGRRRWTYDLRDDWEPPTDDYWKAVIFSPGLKRPVEDPYYPLPGLHAVVFKGGELVHDPNPNYTVGSYEPTVVRVGWWT